MIDLPPQPNYEQTIEAIVRCDIPRANITITYEDELQSDEITISDVGEVTDEKLRCLKDAVHPFYILSLADEAQRGQFYTFAERENRPKWKAEAREWLRANGMLDRLPAFDPARGLASFATEVERACGLSKGTALMPYGTTSLTIPSDFVRSKDFEKLGQAFLCLSRMIAASNADEHGISFILIGNEAFRESDEN